PAPQAAPAMRPPPGREYDAATPLAVDLDNSPPAGGGGVTAAAVCLLVAALIGALVNGYFGVSFLVLKGNPAEFDRVMNEAINRNPNIQADQRDQAREVMIWFRDYGIGSFGALAGLNLLTALGAVMMLARRGYWLAVLGCLAALNPVNFGCCFLVQIPFGIWGLIVLLGSGRRAFR